MERHRMAEGTRNWVGAERCRAAVRDLAQELAPRGLRLMVMKGTHLAFEISPDPGFRSMADADVLVDDFRTAVRHIHAGGRWRIASDDWSTKTIVQVDGGAFVDLHRSPLPPAFGRMDAQAVLRRSRPAGPSLGPHLRVPDPLDAAAIAIAHFVKDGLGAVGPGALDRDLALLHTYGDVTPTKLARHLSALGLRLRAVVAFVAVRERMSQVDAFLSALAPRPWEQAVAAAAIPAFAAVQGSPYAALLLARALEDRALDSAFGVGWWLGRGTLGLVRRFAGVR